MLQDLAPYHFDFTYRPDSAPRPKDRVISVRGNELLLRQQANVVRYPQVAEVAAQPEQLTYLFRIGHTQYYLGHDLQAEGYTYQSGGVLRQATPKHLAYAGLMGLQVASWYKNHTFCGRCGKPMVHDGKERMMRCPSCGLMEFPKICPCVIVGVIHDGKILVSRYHNRAADHYAMIAGFAEAGETIEQTVAREVLEETQVHVKHLHFYKSQPWPFSESLLFGFFCEVKGDSQITIQEDELSMAKWATPEEITEPFNDFSLTNEMLHYFKRNFHGSIEAFYEQIDRELHGDYSIEEENEP